MGRPIVHFEINGHNGPELHSFYSRLFDWQVDTDRMPGYGLVKTADSGSINGGIYQCKETDRPSVTFYIHVEDLQKYLDKVVSLGGKTIVPPSPIPGVGDFAMFADPAGNVLGLFKPNMG